LVSERYEKGSIILTSNKKLRRLGRHLRRQRHRFGHPRPAAAPLDHINIKGESYRLKDKKKAGVVAAKLPGRRGA